MTIRLFEELLPSYLTAITPVVILDNEECPRLRLLFLCNDQSPSIMILHETWEAWYTAWQQIPETFKIKYNSCHMDSSTLDTFHDILVFRRRYYDLDCSTSIEKASTKEIADKS